MTTMMNLDGNGRMDWFFNEWVYGTELPRYKLDYSLSDEGGKTLLRFRVQQSDVSPGFKMIVPLYLDFDGRPAHVLLNARHDVLASEVLTNGKRQSGE